MVRSSEREFMDERTTIDYAGVLEEITLAGWEDLADRPDEKELFDFLVRMIDGQEAGSGALGVRTDFLEVRARTDLAELLQEQLERSAAERDQSAQSLDAVAAGLMVTAAALLYFPPAALVWTIMAAVVEVSAEAERRSAEDMRDAAENIVGGPTAEVLADYRRDMSAAETDLAGRISAYTDSVEACRSETVALERLRG